MRRTPLPNTRHLRLPPFTEALPRPIFFRTEHMPANATYPALCHRWGEFVYSFTGIMEIEVGGSYFLVPPSMGIWIPEGFRHTGFNHQEVIHCSIYITPRLCAGMPQEPCAVIVSSLARSLLEYLRELPPAHHDDRATARLLRVLADQLLKCTTTGSYLPYTEEPPLDAILQALRSDPADPRSLTELAHDFHIGKRTLIRRCDRELGMSLNEWRQRLRLVNALPRLQLGQSVESVALDLGYSTASAFIAMFRRFMGVSPGRFISESARNPGDGERVKAALPSPTVVPSS